MSGQDLVTFYDDQWRTFIKGQRSACDTAACIKPGGDPAISFAILRFILWAVCKDEFDEESPFVLFLTGEVVSSTSFWPLKPQSPAVHGFPQASFALPAPPEGPHQN